MASRDGEGRGAHDADGPREGATVPRAREGITAADTSPTAALFAALAAAGRDAEAVARDATNAHHRYRYASAEAIYAEGRAALHAHGLALVPLSETLTGDGDARAVDLAYELTHAGGGSMTLRRMWPVVTGAGRPADKALAGATTTALAYLVRDLLLLPRVEEEVDRREDRPTASSARRPREGQATPVATSSSTTTTGPTVEDLHAAIAALSARAPEDWRPEVTRDVRAAGREVAALTDIRDALAAALTREGL